MGKWLRPGAGAAKERGQTGGQRVAHTRGSKREQFHKYGSADAAFSAHAGHFTV
ncbi:hypothetical protein [Pontibacter beigongshangensis]|uniref:hypothetical protein n=1 Tax=Pontibacter beigongshangensis TaxID=2574733 RepID=UPI001650144C|nr:hypothetical protein [Pontibacter beigongshangensis]